MAECWCLPLTVKTFILFIIITLNTMPTDRADALNTRTDPF